MPGYLAWSALSLFGVGAFSMALGFGWGAGPRIGSAHLPLLLSGLLVLTSALGLLAHRVDLKRTDAPIAEWRPFGAVVVAVILFLGLIEHVGLIPTVLISMFAAYLGQSEQSYLAFLTYSAAFAVLVWLIFSKGLGMPVPAFAS